MATSLLCALDEESWTVLMITCQAVSPQFTGSLDAGIVAGPVWLQPFSEDPSPLPPGIAPHVSAQLVNVPHCDGGDA